MKYTIVNVKQYEDTLTTIVEASLSTGTVKIEISHFRPLSVEDINQNIQNRLLSEQSKIDAVEVISYIAPMIPIGETVII